MKWKAISMLLNEETYLEYSIRSIIDFVENLTLLEGKRNHIRRIFAKFRLTIKDLYRFGLGNLNQGQLQLPEGSWTNFSPDDIFAKTR